MLLDTPHLVDRGIGVLNDLKLVKGDSGVGQVVSSPLIKAGDMSIDIDSMACGSPPWVAKSLARAPIVSASLP